MSYWNHRVLQETDEYGDTTYRFIEVYYNDDNKMLGYGEPFVGAENTDALQELVGRLQGALDKTIVTQDMFEELDILGDNDSEQN